MTTDVLTDDASAAHPRTPHNCLQCEDAEIASLVSAGCDWHWAVLRVINAQHWQNRTRAALTGGQP